MQDKQFKRQMFLCILGISTVGIPLGLLGPVTVMLLEQNHMPTWINGLFVTMAYLTIFLFSPITGKLVNRYGIKKIFILGMLLMFIGSFGLPAVFNIPILFLSRALMGIGVTMGFVSTEILINVLSTDEKRNQNITIYIMIFSLGIAIGSSLIWTVKIFTLLPYIIGTSIIFVVMVISQIFLHDTRISYIQEKKKKFPITLFPMIGLFTAVLYGFFESSITVVLPIYGLRTGFNQDQTTILITTFVVGGIVVYYLLSQIYKGLYYTQYILISLIFTLVLFLLPIKIDNLWLQSLIFFLLGGFIPSLYSLGLSYTMSNVDREYTAEANGYYSASYGFGTLLGPILASKLLDIDAKSAYWIFGAILSLLTIIIIRINYGKNKN